MLKVFSEKKKTVLFEQVVVPVDIDNVPEMEKTRYGLVVGDGSFQR